jgi:hypothetical protein
MVFKATFNNISVICGSQFYWWRKSEDMEKPTDVPQITDKLYQSTIILIDVSVPSQESEQ